MKPTKKLEAEILNVYEPWLNSYLNGDVDTYDYYLDEDYHFIGSTNNEEFLDKKDTTQFFADTGDQFAGKTDLRNQNKIIEKFGELVFITHSFDAYFRNDEDWVYYGRFRFSSVLRENKEGWRFIYQHFSTTDSKTDEGDSIGFDKVNEENQELREAIKRRTVELEQKNRELEIETALEKIRSRASAMQGSEELQEVIKVVYNQFLNLNINVDHAGFVVDYNPKSDWHFWIADQNSIPSKVSHPYFENAWATQFEKAKQTGDDFFATEWDFEAKNKFYEKLLSFVPDLPEESRNFYMDCPGLAASTVLMQDVALYIENFEGIPYTHQENEILKRFGRVFQQAYTRFLDLQKAEAQAKEAKIEAALEKVRSRSLAMQSGDELSEVVLVIVEKLKELGVILDANGITLCTYFQESKDIQHWIASPDFSMVGKYLLPYFDHKILREAWESKERGDPYFSKAYTIEEKNSFFDHAFQYSDYKHFPDEFKQWIYKNDKHTLSFAWQKHSALLIPSNTGIEPSEEDKAILIRFSKVFEQAYIRFMDLQKAEAQAKEAKIEAALEKVRSKAIGMQNSEDFSAVTDSMFEQIRILGGELFAAGIVFCDKHEGHVEQWHSIPGAGMLTPFIVPIDLDYIHQYRYDQWKKGTELFSIEIPSDFIEQHFEDIFNLPSAQIVLKDLEERNTPMPAAPPWEIDYGASFKNGYILVSALQPFEEAHILPRFAKVFEQAYTRYLDLKKAEAQAREAQIETALERVRSVSMAMHSSGELVKVATTVYRELIALGFENVVNGGFNFPDADKNITKCWFAETEDGVLLKDFEIPYDGDSVLNERHEYRQKGIPFLEQTLHKEDLKRHMEFVFPTDKSSDKELAARDAMPNPTIFSIQFLNKGYMILISNVPLSEEQKSIMERFAKAFNQAYTRFLDLQKAEAQSREAQINLAVERVRAKALAMHKSEEIMEVVDKLKDEVMGLDIPGIVAASIFLEAGNDNIRMWDLSSLEWSDKGYLAITDITFKLKKVDPHLYIKRVWENTDNYFVEVQNAKDLDRIIEFMYENNQLEVAKEVEDYTRSTNLQQLYHASKRLNNGKLCIDFLEPPPNEMEGILNKIGAAFDLAYKRFEDLQKAEAQAREAQIEAALERVRARSMAMHKSKELLDVIKVVSEQLLELDFKFNHVSFANNDLDGEHKFWVSFKGGPKPILFNIPFKDIHVFNSLREAQEKKEPFFTDVISVKDHRIWHEHLLKHSPPHIFSKSDNEYIMSKGLARSAAINENIILIVANMASIPYSQEQNKIIERFGKVFEQSYTRFLDLTKAEAQAREAKIESALEKVRSRTLAMENSSEFAETSVVVFQQMLELGISPNRLFIGIIDQGGKIINAWATNEDGTKISDNFTLEASKNKSISKMIAGMKKGQSSIVIEMKGQELQNYYDYLHGELGIPFQKGLKEKRRIQYIAYFSGGILGLAAAEEQAGETMELLERFASVFNLTYTRFKDLKIAEAQAIKAEQDLIEIKKARERAESALSDLQATQKQLIQSEKMASLGELTAGIAHEIQNPLNFVNNFSEVSTELLEEITEELENGDIEEVKAILGDIKNNLEKINHHGKRADSIVKGMLQHSRSSSGEKEPTDINQLAEEYFNLAYHGLRAKDKSFNSKMETTLDARIGKLDVVPQEIGRVLLNIINNAFYAVTEKQKILNNGFEPKVELITSHHNDSINITVKDNGGGMPKNVVDKIFQPFYTTKPTGQGTGLGLSMSYDIIKAHGGEIEVESVEGDGTSFKVKLPITAN